MQKKIFNSLIIKIIKYFFLIFSIFLLLFIGSIFVFSKYYNNEIKEITLKQVNKHLNSPISFDEISLSVFSHFPLVSISINNISILDPVNEKDTLLYSSSLDLSFSALDFFKRKYNVIELVANKGFGKIHINELGEKNFLVFKSDNEDDSNQIKFVLEQLTFIDFFIFYQNDLLSQDYSFFVNNSSLKGNFSSEKYDLKINSNLNVNYFRLDDINYIDNKKANIFLNLKVENIPFKLKIEKGNLIIADMHFSVEGNYLSSKRDYVDLILKGDKIQLSEVFSVFPVDDLAILKTYNSTGDLKFNARLSGELSPKKPLLFTSTFRAENASFEYNENNINLSNIYLDGEFNNRNQILEIKSFSALIDGNKVKGAFKLKDFHQPKLNVDLEGHLDLKNTSYWIPNLPFELDGLIAFDFISEINLDQKVVNKFNGSLVSNKLFLKDLKANISSEIEDLKIDFNNQDIILLAGQLQINEEKCKVYFKLNHWMDIVFENSKEIVADFDLDFEAFKLDYWMDYFADNEDSANSNFDFYLKGNVSADSFYYDSIIFTDLDFNNISISNKINIESLKMNGQGGEYDLNISTSNFDLINPYLDIKGDIIGLKLNQIFSEFKNFDQSLIMDNNLSGKWSSDFSARFFYKLNNGMVLENLNLLSVNNFDQIKLVEYPFLEDLLQYFESSIITRNIMDLEYYKNHINEVVFEDFYSTLSIKNGLVDIGRTSLKNNLLNFNFYGYYDHSDTVDYHLNFNWKEIRKHRKDNFDVEELGKQLFLRIYGHMNNLSYGLDKKEIKKLRKQKINQEKEIIIKIIKGEEIDQDTTDKSPVFEVELEENDSSDNSIEPKDSQTFKEKKSKTKNDSSKLNKFLKKIGVEEQEKQKPTFEIDQ